eukprot:jgi/Chrzof1/3350/Cz12g21240.t1
MEDVNRRVAAFASKTVALPDEVLSQSEKGGALACLVLLREGDRMAFVVRDQDTTTLVEAVKDLLQTGPAKRDSKRSDTSKRPKSPPCTLIPQLPEPQLLRHRRPFSNTDP